MSKTEELYNLFDDWAKSHEKESEIEYVQYHTKSAGEPGYISKRNFICDGIISEVNYNSSKPKILFIAKECHIGNDTVNIKEDILKDCRKFWATEEIEGIINKEWASNAFWRGLAMYYNAIKNNDYFTPNKDIPSLFNIAFINLNKRGGYDYCAWNTLKRYVDKYKKQIKEEIQIINPEIIICCSKDVKYLVDKNNLADDRKVTWAFHPSYRRSDLKKLDYLKTNILALFK